MHLLVKPAGAACNLACPRCFYRDRAGLYPEGPDRMPPEVARRLMGAKSIAFQGGEPLLMGLDFFRQFAGLNCSLQTNGTLIDRETADFLARERWLTGISFDGPPKIHNLTRDGSYAAARRGLEFLREAGAEFNVLVLVSSANVDAPETVYRFVRDELGASFHQYIPCTEDLAPGAWGEFLVRLFDEWRRGDAYRISVRNFDNLVNLLALGRHTSCDTCGDCRNYLVVERNGDVYPCDFHVAREWRLGNVLTDSFEAMANCDRYREFGRRKSELHLDCRHCNYLRFCHGDCVKNRGSDGKSRLCPGLDRFLAHALPHLRQILALRP